MIYDMPGKKETQVGRYIVYSLHLYFNDLSLRNTSKALSRFVQRSHTAIRDWIQKYKPKRLFCNKIKIAEFIIDETHKSKLVLN